MNRVWDYCGFVIWFLGFLTMSLWLVGPPERWMLPPGLHILGLVAAALVALRLLILGLKARRTRAAARLMLPRAVQSPRPPPPRPAPLPTVKPRQHFGLRGIKR